MLGDLRELLGEPVEDLDELGMQRGGVGLVLERVRQRRTPGQAAG